MKKLLCMFFAVLIIVFATASCANRSLTHFEILEVGGYDSLSGANHSDDIRLKNTRTQEKNVAKKKSIVSDGKEIELPYAETRYGYLYRDTIDAYEGLQSGHMVIAEFNRDTGKMDFYSNPNLINKNAGNLSRVNYLAVAQEYLSNYVEDVEQYTIVEEEYPETGRYYTFTFVRITDGIKTCDRASISVTQQGDVWLHSFLSLGEMRGAVLPPQETMDAIWAGLNERLDTIYAPVKDKYTVSYELDEEQFIRLADGSYALDYCFEVKLASEADGLTRGELAHFLVRLS